MGYRPFGDCVKVD